MTTKMAGVAMITSISSRLFGALALVAGLGLSGCADIDNMLFGESGEEAAPEYAQPSAIPEAAPPGEGGLPARTVAVPGGTAVPVLTITPIPIEPVSNTGTAVSGLIASLHGQVVGLEGSLMQNAQRLADLRASGASLSSSYYAAKARITTRLQIGTTRSNPELVSERNAAQAALDQLSANLNDLNALGAAAASNSSTAHYTLDQIMSAYKVAGALDEDHRQLSVLESETSQTIVLIDRILSEVATDVQHQTAHVANERANLTTLTNAIKNGELYGADLSMTMTAAALASPGGNKLAYSGTPLVVIRFDHPDVDYQQILYAALSQALQSHPSTGFAVVAVSPTRGTAAAVRLAQTAAHRHAEEVMRTMTDMGVPASRLMIASATDPLASASEVRVFVR